MNAILDRTTFQMSRLLEFFSEKELPHSIDFSGNALSPSQLS
jgi:hypothetical protein